MGQEGHIIVADTVSVADHNEALSYVENYSAQKRSQGLSQKWLFTQIENLVRQDGGSFFSEGEIWEMVEAFS